MIDVFIEIYSYIYILFTTDIVNLLEEKVGGAIERTAPLFLIGFSIYVVLLSLNWLREGVDENLLGTIKSMTGWLFVIALAFNASNYMIIATAFYELPDRLASTFSNVDFSNTSAFTGTLNTVNLLMEKIEKALDDLPWYRFGAMGNLMVSGLIIQACALALFILVFAFYLIAKISLLLVLFLGPIFIGFMLYPSTRQYGMNWIGQILNNTFTIVLYILANGLIIQVANHVFEKINGVLGSQAPDFAMLYAALIVLVITVLLFFVIFNIPGIASALTGGASISASGGMRFLTGAKGLSFMRNMQGKGGGSIINANRGRK